MNKKNTVAALSVVSLILTLYYLFSFARCLIWKRDTAAQKETRRYVGNILLIYSVMTIFIKD